MQHRSCSTGALWVALTMAAFGMCFGQAYAQSTQSPVQERPAVQPQIDLAGMGIATLDLSTNGTYRAGAGSNSQIDFSDSGLVVSASERLYKGETGSFSLGGIALNQQGSNNNDNTQVFLCQAFADYLAPNFEGYVGRTDNPTSGLVDFPILRHDDLADFTTVDDPYSNGANAEENLYSTVAAVTFNQGLTHFENFHAQHLIDSAGIGGTDDSGVNSYGVSYQYRNSPNLEAIQRLVTYGVGFEYRPVPRAFGGASNAVYAGGTVNLVPSLVNRVDLTLFDDVTFGNDNKTFTTMNDTYRNNANSIAASLRYLHSPFGIPGYQISLTAGYKSFDAGPGGDETGLALTGAKRLGDRFDAVAQLGYFQRSGAVEPIYSHRDATVFQIGLSYAFDSIFNQQIGPRRTPLNMLHTYIPD